MPWKRKNSPLALTMNISSVYGIAELNVEILADQILLCHLHLSPFCQLQGENPGLILEGDPPTVILEYKKKKEIKEETKKF